MSDLPFTFNLPSTFIPDKVDSHIVRRLTSMRGQFADAAAYDRMAQAEDTMVYEVYEFRRPETAGDLRLGISIVHPGRVGGEYFMTKGHFHTVLETAEVYFCLAGEGRMVMETPDGECAVEELRPGKVLYVPPCWAHRSVNTCSKTDLITFFVYPAHAGHDYATIETRGFRKLVLAGEGAPRIVDNPRWSKEHR